MKLTFTAARTTLPFTCWNCGTTRSHMCSLSFFILHNVSAQRIENGHPTPLGTLVKGDEELAQNGTRYFEKAWVGWRRARLRHGSVVDVG